ncbi:MAG: adenosylcobinamide-phosphate synthase CbiB [Panacagrimonas sp.]
MIAVSMSLALLLDWLLGEPRRWHPLVAFGRLVLLLERRLYAPSRWRGACGVVLLAVTPALVLGGLRLQLAPAWTVMLDVLFLYVALGHRSLHDHARPVAAALAAGDEDRARNLAARMVSRDSAAIAPAAAATESVLENGNDGVFGALFWFALLGAPGALLFRLANTLDAMWGYRNERFECFGWAAARFDDLLNWPGARLTALSYALCGNRRKALRCWRAQAPSWDSPNAGPVMAAGAGALGIELGGPARYQGQWHQRPTLGCGRKAQARDIERALTLVRHSVLLWVVVACVVAGGWPDA